MYIKFKEDELKQIIFCCPDMSYAVLESKVATIDECEQVLHDDSTTWKFCPYCGEKVIISEV